MSLIQNVETWQKRLFYKEKQLIFIAQAMRYVFALTLNERHDNFNIAGFFLSNWYYKCSDKYTYLYMCCLSVLKCINIWYIQHIILNGTF